MTVSLALYLALLGLVACERLVELVISRRNAAWARERGGIEVGRGHFRLISALHTLLLPACFLEVWLLDRPWLPWLGIPMLVLLIGAQGLRWWAVSSLGRRWNVRIVVVPGMPVVASGPYRLVRHPNYVAVVVELIAIPLVHAAWLTALFFTLLNLPLLAVRIRTEERALTEHGDYQRLGGRPRFVPRRGGGDDPSSGPRIAQDPRTPPEAP